MKVYRMIGVPAGAPVPVLLDHRVGDEFQAELDKDEERTLLDAGALEVVKQSVKQESSSGQSSSKEKS